VIDHLIISDETCHSVVNWGIFKKLQGSERWILPYKLKERIRNEGEKKGKIEMAKALKQKEISVMMIAETSGSSIEEIKNYEAKK